MDIVNGAALELSAEAVSFGAKLTSAMTSNDHSAEEIRDAIQSCREFHVIDDTIRHTTS